ncbi:MAG TPA: DUF2807 domain-containing protein [Caulobacteraceae bacterium]|nr:DUF2807 domain-containing protein [Caulobacteraceae bacterium]
MKAQLFAAAAAAVLTTAAGAAQAVEVEIKDAVARVVVIPENRADIAVTVAQGSAGLPALQVTRTGSGNVNIDGDLKRKIKGCTLTGLVMNDHVDPMNPPSNLTVRVADHGDVKVADAALITIRTPMDVRIEAGGAVFGAIGRSTSVELANAGCGDWTVANVNGPLKVSIAGSGDLRAGTASTLTVGIAGSGDVHVGSVRSLDASIAGSGDVRVARVDGPIEASIAGSGDVRVDDGRSERVNASIAGSGDVNFGGTAGTLKASVIGSGDVRARSVTGEVKKSVMGSGDVVVGR